MSEQDTKPAAKIDVEIRADRSVHLPRRFRVVFVDHVARLSGGEIALVRLLDAIREQVDAHVILGEDGPLRPALEAAGATVEVLAMGDNLREVRRGDVTPARLDPRPAAQLCRYVWRLRRRIHELRPDLVHTNSLKAALYGGVAARLAGVPVVWHVRDRIAPDYLPRAAVVLVRALSLLLPTEIVANSSATLETLPRRRHSAPSAERIVPDIAPQPADPPDAAAECPGADRPLRVGIVGRLAPWKGHHVFLRAFARAYGRGDAEAVVVGSAMFGEEKYASELRHLVEKLGITEDVVWRGFQQDVAAELAQLDILVHASTTPEPFGQVIIEGMAAGLPVIASAAGGPLEIVDHGRDGLLVAPDDPAKLADALRTLTADPPYRRRLGQRAQQSSRRFSPEAARTRLLAAYVRAAH